MQLSSYTKDNKGNYLCVSPEFVLFTHAKSPDDLIGKSDREMPWTSCCEIIAHDKEVMHTGESRVFIEKPMMNGMLHIRRCFKSPLLGRTGKVLGISGISFSVNPSTLIALTKVQTACLKAFAKGGSIKKIAKELGLSPRTVEHYLNILKIKLNCHSKNELLLQALARGLIHL